MLLENVCTLGFVGFLGKRCSCYGIRSRQQCESENRFWLQYFLCFTRQEIRSLVKTKHIACLICPSTVYVLVVPSLKKYVFPRIIVRGGVQKILCRNDRIVFHYAPSYIILVRNDSVSIRYLWRMKVIARNILPPTKLSVTRKTCACSFVCVHKQAQAY